MFPYHGMVLFLVMATWRWGRKATFAAYSAKSTMTIAELIDLHRQGVFGQTVPWLRRGQDAQHATGTSLCGQCR
jgi:hypothetical protein